MNQSEIFKHIKDLTDEEQNLFTKGDLDGKERSRLNEIDEELNQYWDLLRQRRALREFDRNPERAKLRNPDVINNYEQ
jgi:hypothetical protein